MIGCKQLQVLAFDFDGVLVDSLPVRDEGFRQVFLDHGEEIADRAKTYHISNRGLFRLEKFRRIFEEVIGVTPKESQLAEAEDRFVNYIHQGILDAPLLSGVADFCSYPPPIPLYVVSAAPGREVLLVARHKGISHIFKEILGGPVCKANHFKKILTRENCSPQSMLFVGDALNDFKAASEVGCRFIGIVPTGKESPFPSGTATFNDFESVLDSCKCFF